MKGNKYCDLKAHVVQLSQDDYLSEVKSFGFFRTIFVTGMSLAMFYLIPFMTLMYIGLILL